MQWSLLKMIYWTPFTGMDMKMVNLSDCYGCVPSLIKKWVDNGCPESTHYMPIAQAKTYTI